MIFLQNKEWTANNVPDIKSLDISSVVNLRASSVIPICAVTKRLSCMGRLLFAKRFDCTSGWFYPRPNCWTFRVLATPSISKRFGRTPNLLVISNGLRSQGSDVGFGKTQPPSPDTSLRVHTYNSPIVMDLAQCDAAICPTHWQADQFPSAMRRNLSVIFDGVNTEHLPLVLQNDGIKP